MAYVQETAGRIVGGSIGYPDTKPSEPELAAILGRLQGANNQASSIEIMLSGTVDRLGGNRPPAGESTGLNPVRSGLVGELNDALDRLNTALDRIHSECATLNRFA